MMSIYLVLHNSFSAERRLRRLSFFSIVSLDLALALLKAMISSERGDFYKIELLSNYFFNCSNF